MTAPKPRLTGEQAWQVGSAMAALEASRDDTGPGNCHKHRGMLEIQVQQLLVLIDELTGGAP